MLYLGEVISLLIHEPLMMTAISSHFLRIPRRVDQEFEQCKESNTLFVIFMNEIYFLTNKQKIKQINKLYNPHYIISDALFI